MFTVDSEIAHNLILMRFLGILIMGKYKGLLCHQRYCIPQQVNSISPQKGVHFISTKLLIISQRGGTLSIIF